MSSEASISHTFDILERRKYRVLPWLRSKLVLGIYLAAVAVFFALPFLAIEWSEQPFLGFVVEQTMVVADYDGSGWSGRLSGMEYPEKVTHINNNFLDDQQELKNVMIGMYPRQLISVQTLLPDGSTKTYDGIRVMDFPRVDFLRLFWMPYLIGIAYLAIGGWVYWARGNTPPGKAFVIFSISSALGIGLLFDLITTHVFSFLWLLAISSPGGSLLSLAIRFPEESGFIKAKSYLQYIPYLISLGLFTWGAIYLYSTVNPWLYIQTWRLNYIYSAIGIVAFLGIMLYRLKTSNSQQVHQQVRAILVGSLIAFIPISIWMGAPLFGVFITWNPAIFLPILLIFPLTIAIAIVRYRLWDIEVIINRTLVYAVLMLILGTFYFVSMIFLQTIIAGILRNPSTIATAASTLGVALLFNPLRKQVQDFIDRRFFRRKYDITQTMTAFVEKIRDEVDLDNLQNALVSVVDETMGPETISFCNCMEGDNKFAQLAPDDPFRTFILDTGNIIDVSKLTIISPAVEELTSRKATLAVPLVSQGEPVGILMLGAKRSGQKYSNEDHRLLIMLATQVAPVLRVAHLVREQKEEALNRQRVEQELQIARLIQQSLIPKQFPELEGWRFAGFYQPARAVGGDFYDFINFSDGRVAILIGDVADKGIPAALVMANTRSLLRSTAFQLISPASVLKKVNDLLLPDLTNSMFVTCFYAVIEPDSGRVTFANAGHNPPYMTNNGSVEQLYVTGMPLGWMPDRTYEEKEIFLAPGESILLYSDGLVESHDDQYDMFGNPRLQAMLCEMPDKLQMIDILVGEYSRFTGTRWGQEDDVTLMAIHRLGDKEPVYGETTHESHHR